MALVASTSRVAAAAAVFLSSLAVRTAGALPSPTSLRHVSPPHLSPLAQSLFSRRPLVTGAKALTMKSTGRIQKIDKMLCHYSTLNGDAVENKSTVLFYGGGGIVAVWLSSIVVLAINSVPLLPKLMELIGLGYTGWFVYRYLLFKQSRKDLATDIEALKKKLV